MSTAAAAAAAVATVTMMELATPAIFLLLLLPYRRANFRQDYSAWEGDFLVVGLASLLLSSPPLSRLIRHRRTVLFAGMAAAEVCTFTLR